MINEKQNYYETDVGHFSFDKHKLSEQSTAANEWMNETNKILTFNYEY